MDLLIQELAAVNTTKLTITVTSSPSTTSTVAASVISELANPTITAKEKSVDLGMIIGASVGVPLSVLVIGLLVLLFWKQRWRNEALGVMVDEDATTKMYKHSRHPNPPQIWTPPHEVSGMTVRTRIYEMGLGDVHADNTRNI